MCFAPLVLEGSAFLRANQLGKTPFIPFNWCGATQNLPEQTRLISSHALTRRRYRVSEFRTPHRHWWPSLASPGTNHILILEVKRINPSFRTKGPWGLYKPRNSHKRSSGLVQTAQFTQTALGTSANDRLIRFTSRINMWFVPGEASDGINR